MAGPPYQSQEDRPGDAGLRSIVAVAAVAVLCLGAGAAFFGLSPLFAGVAALLVVAAALLPASRRKAAGRAASKAAERELRWPDAGIRAAVNGFPKAALLLDGAGAVLHANASAADLFPATRPGDPFTLTFRRPEFAEALEIAGSGQKTTVEFRETGEAATTYEVTVSPLRSSDGAVIFLLVTFDDVSDRLAIARMRADFVANASHELRTPLASLTGFIETLLGPARNDPAASETFLRVMLDQARRMRRLIDDLLSLSRAEMRVHSRPTAHVDLAAVLRTAGDALQPLAAEHGVALSFDTPADLVEVVGDRDELIQLAQNLIENAIRYGASGGRVEVTLGVRPGGTAVMRVRDYGAGIPAEHIPRLTERFYRVDVGASREMKGTGLGLAIVKHIVTRHRGRLEIESRPGEGASFTVTLPLAGPERP